MPATMPASTVAGSSCRCSVSSAIACAHCASCAASDGVAARMRSPVIGRLPSGLDDAACDARAGIARRLRPVIVCCRMHDEGAADDVVARATAQDDTGDAPVDMRYALHVGDDVVDVAGVMRGCPGLAVRAAGRIEMAAGTGGVGRAAVAGFVHVEAVAAARREPT